MRPFVVGESNPYGADPGFALYPAPDGCTGERLCRRILRLSRGEYLAQWERRNLLTGDKWSVVRAREAAYTIAKECESGKIVLLGAKVAAAFGLPFRPFESVGGRVLVLPHPSGLSRLWNAPGAWDRAHAAVQELLKFNPEERDHK